VCAANRQKIDIERALKGSRAAAIVPPTVTEGTLRRTSLFEEHKALGARIVPFAGWEMPVQYSGVVQEHRAVREAAGLFDVSHMGELALEGEHAEGLLDWLVTNDVKKLPDDKALYTVACNDKGTILDDLIVYRRARERFLVVCNASNRAKISAHFATAAEHHCRFSDDTDRTALLALQGPRAVEVLGAAGGSDAMQKLAPFHLTDGSVASVAVMAARTGYTGEDGFELFCAWEDAPALWRRLIEVGKPFGLLPIGLGARDTLRLEARLSLYGNDIDETTNPIEAGLGWVVKLDKGDFLGRAALERVKREGPQRKLVGFEMVGRGIGRHGYPIVDTDGAAIGVVTSGSPGPTVGKNIGLGYVPAAMSEIGTKLGIEIRGNVIEAVVVKTPFYKRQR